MSHLTSSPSANPNSILVLITHCPNHPLANKALLFCQAYANHANQQNTLEPRSLSSRLKIFFYGDAANTANCLNWQPADQKNLTQDWQNFAHKHHMTLPVCVSTALARGVSDADNAKRHQLTTDNLATGFQLVGLSELALLMDTHKVVTF